MSNLLPTEVSDYCFPISTPDADYLAVRLRNWELTTEQVTKLACIPNLREIEVDSRKIGIDAACKLLTLENVDTLSFRSESITDAHINAMARYMKGLASLSLYGRNISNLSVERIAESALTKLFLTKTKVDNRGLYSLAEGRIANTLHSLGLSGTEVSSEATKPLSKLSALVELSLRDARISDHDVEQLSHRLQFIDLSGTDISDASGLSLRLIDRLSTLYVQRTNIGNAFIQALENHRSLTVMRLDKTLVDGGIVSSLLTIPKLIEVSAIATSVASTSTHSCLQQKFKLVLR